MFRISYSRKSDTNLYLVTFHALRQTIVVSHVALVKNIGMDPRCVVGCQDVPVGVIMELGFVFPSKNARLIV